MANLIYSIPSGNNGEQHKDNNNGKYLELNKDRMLNLGEKNYENLVEAFAKNAINVVDASSSSLNATLSLPQSSSSTFPNSFDQSDTFRKKSQKFMIMINGNQMKYKQILAVLFYYIYQLTQKLYV
jgi:hypothetical protein